MDSDEGSGIRRVFCEYITDMDGDLNRLCLGPLAYVRLHITTYLIYKTA